MSASRSDPPSRIEAVEVPCISAGGSQHLREFLDVPRLVVIRSEPRLGVSQEVGEFTLRSLCVADREVGVDQIMSAGQCVRVGGAEDPRASFDELTEHPRRADMVAGGGPRAAHVVSQR